jgi:hypothetical protein
MAIPGKSFALGVLVAAACSLSACGTDPGDRAVSGGLLGAGGGAAIGAIAGHTTTGLIVGGVAGALAGGLSDPCSVNLGAPIWRNKHASREDYKRRCGHYPR